MSISRKFLLPFSPIYGLATKLRNLGYDKGVFESRSYSIPIICVGNLSVGGTGKSPMVEYLINHLKNDYRLATLSRGYGRTTKGFHLLKNNDLAEKVGDEPLQFNTKFPEVIVAVDENRQRGIDKLIEIENPDVVILDDAFQHRKVKAGLNILLTTYGDLYTDDLLLPAGNLREPVSGAGRAEIVVVTKCPQELSKQEQESISTKLNLSPEQKLFFGYIEYSSHLKNDKGSISLGSIIGKQILLITGIANDRPLLDHLKNENLEFEHLSFPDHHNYSRKEIEGISAEIVLTTEKDYMRLKDIMPHPGLYYIPIQFKFIVEEEKFDRKIDQFTKNEK